MYYSMTTRHERKCSLQEKQSCPKPYTKIAKALSHVQTVFKQLSVSITHGVKQMPSECLFNVSVFKAWGPCVCGKGLVRFPSWDLALLVTSPRHSNVPGKNIKCSSVAAWMAQNYEAIREAVRLAGESKLQQLDEAFQEHQTWFHQAAEDSQRRPHGLRRRAWQGHEEAGLD